MQIGRTHSPYHTYPIVYTKYGTIKQQTESGWCYEVSRYIAIASEEKTPLYKALKMFA